MADGTTPNFQTNTSGPEQNGHFAGDILDAFPRNNIFVICLKSHESPLGIKSVSVRIMVSGNGLPPCISSHEHYSDVIMSAIASQITGVSIVYSNVCSDVDQRKHQSSASLAFVRRIHRWPVNSPHKRPVKRKMFPFDDFTMNLA